MEFTTFQMLFVSYNSFTTTASLGPCFNIVYNE